MTYSLNTFHAARASNGAGRSVKAPARSGWGRFAAELVLVVGFVVLGVWLLALLSYSAQDASWSTSGAGGSLHNRAGRVGAWLADASYFVFGFSVWWCFAAGVRAWLSELAHWLRDQQYLEQVPVPTAAASQFTASRAAFWIGLLLMMCASATLEWSRLYSVEARLPGHAGGVLGYLLGPWSMRWLGFAGFKYRHAARQ